MAAAQISRAPQGWAGQRESCYFRGVSMPVIARHIAGLKLTADGHCLIVAFPIRSAWRPVTMRKL